MKLCTNINIKNQDHNFVYLIECNNSEYLYNSELYYNDDININIFNDTDIIRSENEWIKCSNLNDLNITNYRMLDVKVYFPEYSVDIYEKTLYMLTAYTWINGKKVYIGNFLLNRLESLASDRVIKFDGNTYYEYIELKLLDPFDIVYSDLWRNFRENVCHESTWSGYELNNTGAQLSFSLYPVIYSNGNYRICDKYSGGQNFINISPNVQDYLSMSSFLQYEDNGVNIHNHIYFNNNYVSDISLYFKETYGVNLITIKYETIIKDDDNIYQYINSIISKNRKGFQSVHSEYLNNSSWADWSKDINKIINNTHNLNSLNLSWSDWRDGMTIISSVTFYDEAHQEILYVFSNEHLLTKELFSYICNDDVLKIDLNKESIKDMKIYNINAVNKIINNIIQVDKPEDSKSNIIQPVFFKVRDLNNIVIHPTVTENICINLDDYKSRVDTFLIQIENCTFKQIGANSYGIIFKIIGNNLQNKKTSGTYYILDQNKELITTGKYTYEQ